MSAHVDLDLAPLDRLKNPNRLGKSLRVQLNRAASPVKKTVVANAEKIRKHGFLAKSMRIKIKGYPGGRIIAVIGPTRRFLRHTAKYARGKWKGSKRRHRPANYAHLVERGTRRSRARPFLLPAMEAHRHHFQRDMIAATSNTIEIILKS